MATPTTPFHPFSSKMQVSPDAIDLFKGNPRAYLKLPSVEDRGFIQEVASRLKFNDLRESLSKKLAFINEGYCRIGASIETLEPVLHNIWFIFYEDGRNFARGSAEQDGLAYELLRVRGLGHFIRPVDNAVGLQIAKTSAGVVWKDLPFFVEDMTDYWMDDYPTLDDRQRLNFACFLARLASTDLVDDKLCQIALLLFRDTFETMRLSGSLTEANQADPMRTMDDLSILALLPSACAWMYHAGHKIIGLSDKAWNGCSDKIGKCGITFAKSELSRETSAGFSPWRWIYWLRRLDEIVQDSVRASVVHPAPVISEALDAMLSHVEQSPFLKDPFLKDFEAEVSLIRARHQSRFEDFFRQVG